MSLIRQRKPWLCHCAPNLPILWYVNNRYVGELQDATRLTFEPGRHVLQAVSTGSQVKSARVTFSVGRP